MDIWLETEPSLVSLNIIRNDYELLDYEVEKLCGVMKPLLTFTERIPPCNRLRLTTQGKHNIYLTFSLHVYSLQNEYQKFDRWRTFAEETTTLTNHVEMTNLGATCSRLHSASIARKMDGFCKAVCSNSRAKAHVFSCLSKTTAETSPKAMVLFTGIIAGIKYGSSISIKKSTLCFKTYDYIRSPPSISKKQVMIKL